MRSLVALALATSVISLAVAQAAPFEPGERPLAPALGPKPAEPRDLTPLARANTDMLASYHALLTQVSGPAAADLVESQGLWYRYAPERCQIAQDLADKSLRGAHRETPTQCLLRAVVERQAELKAALQTVGPWTFLRLTEHRIRLARPDHGAGPVEESVTRLQIAHPADDGQRRWNATVAHQLDQTIQAAEDLADRNQRLVTSEGRDTSVHAAIELVSVTPDLIDVTIHALADPAGPPPPQSATRSLIWSARLSRPIDATDLFDPKALWRPSLAQMAVDRVVASPGVAPPSAQAVAPLAADPGRWTLTQGGLMVDLRPPTPGAAPVSALVPWPLLSPYLKRPLFVDPSSLMESARG